MYTAIDKRPLHAWHQASWPEAMLLILVMAVLSRAVLPPIFVGLPEDFYTVGLSDPLWLKLFYYSCYLLLAGLSLQILPQLLRIVTRKPLIVGFCTYVLLLSLTSDMLGFSLSNSLEYCLAALISFYIAARYRYAEFVRILACSFAVILAFCVIFIIFLPHIGWQQEATGYGLRGAFQISNTFSYYMALGAPIMITYGSYLGYRNGGIPWLLGGALSVAMTYISTALTGQLILTIILIFMIGLHWCRRSHFRIFLLIVSLLGASIFVLSAFFAFYTEILAFFGKDPTLTNRTLYYEFALETLAQSPLFGTRGTPFLVEQNGEAIIGEAISGHLNIVMFYGAIGGFLYFALVGQLIRGAFRGFYILPDSLRLLPLLFACFWIFGNISEAASGGIFFSIIFFSHIAGLAQWQN